jgi:hypothetical protein
MFTDVTAPRRAWNSYTAESPAGNLVVDLLRTTRPESDVAIYHAGGTRATATMSAAQLARAIARALMRSVLPAARAAIETGELGAFDETHPRIVVPGGLPSTAGASRSWCIHLYGSIVRVIEG